MTAAELISIYWYEPDGVFYVQFEDGPPFAGLRGWGDAEKARTMLAAAIDSGWAGDAVEADRLFEEAFAFVRPLQTVLDEIEAAAPVLATVGQVRVLRQHGYTVPASVTREFAHTVLEALLPDELEFVHRLNDPCQ
jgi:hypothetical protein